MRVLVLGATGLLGNAVYRVCHAKSGWHVGGTIRQPAAAALFAPELRAGLIKSGDLLEDPEVDRLFGEFRPDAVINCVALDKRSPDHGDPRAMIPIYALLPHRLAAAAARVGARLVHVSTDGVFSGNRGGYSEEDVADARDVYGLSKLLGETRGDHTINLRTSILGHELKGGHSLLEWFLSQEKQCTCFSGAIFSGLPTVVLGELIRDVVLAHPSLTGTYHVAADPISKCDLLRLVAKQYGKAITIVPDGRVKSDRSLNAERFRAATGYTAPPWPTLVQRMHASR